MSRTQDRVSTSAYRRPRGEALLWRGVRVASLGATVAGVTVVGSLMLSSAPGASAATPPRTAVLVAVSSGDAPAPTNPAEMPMDMPGMDMSGSSPAPTEAPMPQDMPGMDMGGMDMGGTSPAPAAPDNMAPDMPGMDMGGSSHGAAADRPLAPVLGTFGGGTAAVLLTAGMLRRKEQGADLAKKAARLAGGARK